MISASDGLDCYNLGQVIYLFCLRDAGLDGVCLGTLVQQQRADIFDFIKRVQSSTCYYVIKKFLITEEESEEQYRSQGSEFHSTAVRVSFGFHTVNHFNTSMIYRT